VVTAQELEALIGPLCREEQLELVAVQVAGRAGRPFIRVLIDHRDGPVNIDECTGLARGIQDLLDSARRPLPDYRLEVSSPGIDWPLTYEWQFRKNTGRWVSWTDREGVRIEGRLIEVSEGRVTIEMEGESVEMPISTIAGAKVFLPRPKVRNRPVTGQRMKRKTK